MTSSLNKIVYLLELVGKPFETHTTIETKLLVSICHYFISCKELLGQWLRWDLNPPPLSFHVLPSELQSHDGNCVCVNPFFLVCRSFPATNVRSMSQYMPSSIDCTPTARQCSSWITGSCSSPVWSHQSHCKADWVLQARELRSGKRASPFFPTFCFSSLFSAVLHLFPVLL